MRINKNVYLSILTITTLILVGLAVMSTLKYTTLRKSIKTQTPLDNKILNIPCGLRGCNGYIENGDFKCTNYGCKEGQTCTKVTENDGSKRCSCSNITLQQKTI